MEHHPLQRELAIRLAAVDVTEKRLTELRKRGRELKDRAHELGNEAGSARDALRDAAGAAAAGEGDEVAVQRARKALKAAEGEHELATLELEGISSREHGAEREYRNKRREMCLAGVDVCLAAASIEEAAAWDALRTFCRHMRSRHALAQLASRLGSEAAGPGRFSEPIHYTSETAGLLTDRDRPEGLAGVLSEYGLTRMFSPTRIDDMSVADLLELPLPRAAQAAE